MGRKLGRKLNVVKNEAYVNEEQREMNKKMMEVYKTDPSRKEEAIMYFINQLEGYIIDQYSKKCHDYTREKEDLISEAKLAIIQQLDEYNPEYALTTYFTNYISMAFDGYLDNNVKKQTTNTTRKTREIAKALAECGMTTEDYDSALIGLIVNISPVKVLEFIKKMKSGGEVSFDADVEDYVASKLPTPEETIIHDEQYDTIQNILEKLTEPERIVLCCSTGYAYEKESLNMESEVFSDAEITRVLAAHGYKNMNLEKIYNMASEKVKTAVLGRSARNDSSDKNKREKSLRIFVRER